jgi:hypothetical protein
MFKKTFISYPVLLMTSILARKSCEELGGFVGVSGKTISRMIRPADESRLWLENLARKTFADEKVLFFKFDESLINKMHAECMEGLGENYEGKLHRKIKSYKVLTAMIGDGNITLPLQSLFVFPKELVPDMKKTKAAWIKKLILHVQKMFPHAKIYVVADGAFATKEFLKWCVENKINTEVRMKNNCVVTINNEKVKVKNIDYLIPKGRQEARTIDVLWHDIPLQLTAVKRKDKNGKESIVYQAATFKARPIQHLKIYKKRWAIEKFFRTAKQKLGLQDCYSTKIETQEAHVASVMISYALVRLDQKKRKLDNPESALRAAKLQNVKNLTRYLYRLDQLSSHVYG